MKNRANVLSSLLDNNDILNRSYQQALDATGSAAEENAKYLDSLSGKIQTAKNAYQQLQTSFVSSDQLKSLVDIGTQLLKIVTDIVKTLGGLSTIGFVGGGRHIFKALKSFNTDSSVGAIKLISENLNNMRIGDASAVAALTQEFSNMAQQGTLTNSVINTIASSFDTETQAVIRSVAATQSVGLSWKSFIGIITANPFSAILGGLEIALGVFMTVKSAIDKSRQEAKDRVSEAISNNEANAKSLEETISKYEELKKKLDSGNLAESQSYQVKSQLLSMQQSLTNQYGSYADSIDLVNGKLETQIENMEKLSQKDANSFLTNNMDQINKAVDYMETQLDENIVYGITPTKTNSAKIQAIAKQNGLGVTVSNDQFSDEFQMLNITANGKTRKELKQALESFKDAIRKQFENTSDSIVGQSLIRLIQQKEESLFKNYDDYSKTYDEYVKSKLITDETNKINVNENGISQSYDPAEFFKKYQDAVNEYNKVIYGDDQKAIDQATDKIKAFETAWENALTGPNAQALQTYSDYWNEINNSIDGAGESLEKLKNIAPESVLGKGLDVLKKSKMSNADFLNSIFEPDTQNGKTVQNIMTQAKNQGIISYDAVGTKEYQTAAETLVSLLTQIGVLIAQAKQNTDQAGISAKEWLNQVTQADPSKTYSDMIDQAQSDYQKLQEYRKQFKSGEMDRAGALDMMQEYTGFLDDDKFSDAINNLDASGFIKYTDDINTAISKMQVSKFKENVSELITGFSEIDDEAEQNKVRNVLSALIGGMDLENVSAGDSWNLLESMQQNGIVSEESEQALVGKLAKGGITLGVALRLAAQNVDVSDLENAIPLAEKEVQDKHKKDQLQLFTNVNTSLSDVKKLSDAASSVGTGEYDITSLNEALSSSANMLDNTEALKAVIDSIDINGKVTDANALAQLMSGDVMESAEKLVETINNMELDDNVKQAYKDKVVDAMDLSDLNIGVPDINWSAINEAEYSKVNGAFVRDEISAQAIYALQLKGRLDDSNVMQELRLEQQKLDNLKLTSQIDVITTFNSDMSSLDEALSSINGGTFTYDSLLQLEQSMPELVSEVSKLGISFNDINMDGALDDAEKLKTAIADIKAEKVLKLLNSNITDAAKQKALSGLDFSSLGTDAAKSFINGLSDNVLNAEAKKTLSGYLEQGVDAGAIAKVSAQFAAKMGDLTQASLVRAINSAQAQINASQAIAQSDKTIGVMTAGQSQLTSQDVSKSVSWQTYNSAEMREYANALEYVNGVWQYNTDAIRENREEMAKQQIEINNNNIDQLTDAYSANQKEIYNLKKALEGNNLSTEEAANKQARLNQLMADQSGISSQINQLKLYNAELAESTSAYQRWLDAQSQPAGDEQFNQEKSMYDLIKDTYTFDSNNKEQFGRVGDEKTQAALDYLIPDHISSQGEEKIKQYMSSIAKYFNFDENGNVDTMNRLSFMDDAIAKGLAHVDQNDEFLVNQGVSLEQFAADMGLTTDAVQGFFTLINQYQNQKINLTADTEQLSQVKSQAIAASDAISELTGGQQNFNIADVDTTSEDGMIKKMQEIQQYKDGLDPNVDTTQIQNCNQMLDYLKQQIIFLNQQNGIIVRVEDDGTVTNITQEVTTVQEKLTHLQEKGVVKVGVKFEEQDSGVQKQIEELTKHQELLIEYGFEDSDKNGQISKEQIAAQIGTIEIPWKLASSGNTNTEQPDIETDLGLNTEQAKTDYRTFKSEVEGSPIKLQLTIDAGRAQLTMQKLVSSLEQNQINVTLKTGDTVSVGLSSADADDKIEGLNQKLAGLNSTIATPKVKVGGVALDSLDNIANKLKAVGAMSAKPSVIIKGNALNTIQNIATTLNNIHDKTINITTNRVIHTSSDGSGGTTSANGTAHVHGLAHASGTAHAAGDWGTKRSETALVGELGQELVVDPKSGSWHTVGDNGAEFTHLPKGSIVFNHQQTKDLLDKGKINGRGNAYLRGNAYAGSYKGAQDFQEFAYGNGGGVSDKTVSGATGAINKNTDAVTAANKNVDDLISQLSTLENLTDPNAIRIFIERNGDPFKGSITPLKDVVKGLKQTSEAAQKEADKQADSLRNTYPKLKLDDATLGKLTDAQRQQYQNFGTIDTTGLTGKVKNAVESYNKQIEKIAHGTKKQTEALKDARQAKKKATDAQNKYTEAVDAQASKIAASTSGLNAANSMFAMTGAEATKKYGTVSSTDVAVATYATNAKIKKRHLLAQKAGADPDAYLGNNSSSSASTTKTHKGKLKLDASVLKKFSEEQKAAYENFKEIDTTGLTGEALEKTKEYNEALKKVATTTSGNTTATQQQSSATSSSTDAKKEATQAEIDYANAIAQTKQELLDSQTALSQARSGYWQELTGLSSTAENQATERRNNQVISDDQGHIRALAVGYGYDQNGSQTLRDWLDENMSKLPMEVQTDINNTLADISQKIMENLQLQMERIDNKIARVTAHAGYLEARNTYMTSINGYGNTAMVSGQIADNNAQIGYEQQRLKMYQDVLESGINPDTQRALTDTERADLIAKIQTVSTNILQLRDTGYKLQQSLANLPIDKFNAKVDKLTNSIDGLNSLQTRTGFNGYTQKKYVDILTDMYPNMTEEQKQQWGIEKYDPHNPVAMQADQGAQAYQRAIQIAAESNDTLKLILAEMKEHELPTDKDFKGLLQQDANGNYKMANGLEGILTQQQINGLTSTTAPKVTGLTEDDFLKRAWQSAHQNDGRAGEFDLSNSAWKEANKTQLDGFKNLYVILQSIQEKIVNNAAYRQAYEQQQQTAATNILNAAQTNDKYQAKYDAITNWLEQSLAPNLARIQGLESSISWAQSNGLQIAGNQYGQLTSLHQENAQYYAKSIQQLQTLIQAMLAAGFTMQQIQPYLAQYYQYQNKYAEEQRAIAQIPIDQQKYQQQLADNAKQKQEQKKTPLSRDYDAWYNLVKSVNELSIRNISAMQDYQTFLKNYLDYPLEEPYYRSRATINQKESYGRYVTPEERNLQSINAARLYGTVKASYEDMIRTLDFDISTGALQSGTDEYYSRLAAINEKRAQLDDLEIEMHEAQTKKLEDITNHYQTLLSRLQAEHELAQADIKNLESMGQYINPAERDQQIEDLRQEMKVASDKAIEYRKQLENLEAQGIVQGDELQEMKKNLLEAQKAARDIEYSIRQIELGKFGDLADHLSRSLEYIQKMHELSQQDLSRAENVGNEVTFEQRLGQYRDILDEAYIQRNTAEALAQQIQNELAQGLYAYGDDVWKERQGQVIDLLNQAEQTMQSANEALTKILDDASSHFDNIISHMEAVNTDINHDIDLRQARGDFPTMEGYDRQIKQQQELQDVALKNYSTLYARFDYLVRSGIVKEGTDQWRELSQKVLDAKNAVYDYSKQMISLDNSEIQLIINQFERSIDIADAFIDRLSAIGSLLDDLAKYNKDTGIINQYGLLSYGINYKAFEEANEKLKKLLQERASVIQRYKNDADFGSENFSDKIKEIENNITSAIENIGSAQKTLVDDIVNAAQSELDVLNKVIDLRIQALQKKQDYYNYDKQLKNKTKDIQLLQQQVRALTGVTDAESKAKRARLQAQLQQAREDLNDTVREHATSVQVQGLQDLKQSLAEQLQNWQKDLAQDAKLRNKAIEEMLKKVGSVDDTLTGLLKDVLGISPEDIGINPDMTEDITDRQKAVDDHNTAVTNKTTQQASKAMASKIVEAVNTGNGALLKELQKDYVGLTEQQQKLVDQNITSVINDNTGAITTFSDMVQKHYDNQAKASNVVDAISKIGDVTIGDKDAIENARKQYDSLDAAQKAMVTNYAQLSDAENQIALLQGQVDQLNALIAKLGQTGITLEQEQNVQEAQNLYNKMTPEQQALVDSSKLDQYASQISSLRMAEKAEQQKTAEQLLRDIKDSIDRAYDDAASHLATAFHASLQEYYDKLSKDDISSVNASIYNVGSGIIDAINSTKNNSSSTTVINQMRDLFNNSDPDNKVEKLDKTDSEQSMSDALVGFMNSLDNLHDSSSNSGSNGNGNNSSRNSNKRSPWQDAYDAAWKAIYEDKVYDGMTRQERVDYLNNTAIPGARKQSSKESLIAKRDRVQAEINQLKKQMDEAVKNGAKPRYKGVVKLLHDELALTQQRGGEIITTKDGVLVPLKAGDGVIPNKLTNNLFQMAKAYPNLPGATLNIPKSSSSNNVNVSFGSMLTVNGSVDREVLPELKQILKQSYEYTKNQMTKDAKLSGLRTRRY